MLAKARAKAEAIDVVAEALEKGVRSFNLYQIIH